MKLAKHEIGRLADGRCPFHGGALARIGVAYHGGAVRGALVSCTRGACSFSCTETDNGYLLDGYWTAFSPRRRAEVWASFSPRAQLRVAEESRSAATIGGAATPSVSPTVLRDEQRDFVAAVNAEVTAMQVIAALDRALARTVAAVDRALAAPPARIRAHGVRAHGVRTTYIAGCRCGACRAANATYHRAYHRRRHGVIPLPWASSTTAQAAWWAAWNTP